ncbi:MAG: PQQ-dependent sugar dehydrogenase, partial [Verrucomicrobiales bacterium]|nr:PQQ-dependent sugar dehydrogenase [Verrucomicrobiales bacterium]
MPLEPPRSSPDGTYGTVDAFPGLQFDHPVQIVSPPGDNRLFVVERIGRIVVIPDSAQPARAVFLDLTPNVASDYDVNGNEGITSLAFHPNYAQNGFFYLIYTFYSRPLASTGRHDKLARFQVSAADPNIAQPDSEVPILVMRDEGVGHDWNHALFGPDGYLYMACGDEGDAFDQYQNSQRIDKDFFSGIIRIDVDQKPGSLPPNPHPAIHGAYSIPPDNPFVGAKSFLGQPLDPGKVRTEFWAVGLRNPWRLYFDAPSGQLYCGDVGQYGAEEIDLIQPAGNYGWNYFEGILRGYGGKPPEGVNFDAPLFHYSHGYGTDQGNSVTGGLVYRGMKFSALDGAYLFADYASGNIWALRHEGLTVTSVQRLCGDLNIASFGIDPRTGDVLLVDHVEGKIKKLVYSGPVIGQPLPENLSETGAFSDLTTLTPPPGILPYDINVPFWSDGAQKKRWFSLPDLNQKIGFAPDGHWSFPDGMVWIKQFDLELVQGDASSRRRIETRFLMKNADGVYGLTYRWNDGQTDAALVPEVGMDETFEVKDNQGNLHPQVWRYPGRNECLGCHTGVGGFALGFNTAQLNRPMEDGGGEVENQLSVLSRIGYLSPAAPDPATLQALAPKEDGKASREYRVRSYLHANCAQCHQPGGAVQSALDARISTPLAFANIVKSGVRSSGDPTMRMVTPGAPAQSQLLARISQLGPGHMPPLATRVLDTQAIDLLTEWILWDLSNFQTFAEWQIQYFGSTDAPEAQPNADPDSDGSPNNIEYLQATNPREDSGRWKISAERAGHVIRLSFPCVAN